MGKDLETVKETTVEYTKQGELLKGLHESLQSLSNDLLQIKLLQTGFVAATKDVLKNVIETENKFNRMAINAGKGAKGFKELNNIAVDLQKNLGATRKEATEIVEVFTKRQFQGDLKSMGEATQGFAKATGLGRDEITETMVELSKASRMSDKAIQSCYASLLKVQQTNGITKAGMEAINKSIQTSTFNMKAFGKSDEAIKSMVVNTGKMVSSMEKVGIAASTALDYVERLTDPTRINENIASYAALGISMSDALGGADITGQLTEGLKEFGQKVKEMGPIAGAQYAQAMGISYKDAIKATNLEEITEDMSTPEEKSLEVIKDMADNTKTTMEKLQETFNSLEANFYKLPKEFLAAVVIISGVFGITIKQKMLSVFGIIKKEGDKSKKDTIKNLDEIETAILNIGNNKQKLDNEAQKLLTDRYHILQDIKDVENLIGNTRDKADKKTLKNLKEQLKLKEKESAKSLTGLDKRAKKHGFDDIIGNNIGELGSKGKLPDLLKDQNMLKKMVPKNLNAKFPTKALSKIGGLLGKIPSFFGGIFKKLLASLGPIGIALGILTILINVLQKKVKEQFGDKIEKLMQTLKAIKEKVFDPLINAVLKPIMKLIGWLLDGITKLLQKWFKIQLDNTKAVDDNTKSQEEGPAKLSRASNGNVVSSGGSINSTTESTASKNNSTTMSQEAANNATRNNEEKKEIAKHNKTIEEAQLALVELERKLPENIFASFKPILQSIISKNTERNGTNFENQTSIISEP